MNLLQSAFVRTAVSFLLAALALAAYQWAVPVLGLPLLPRVQVVQMHFLFVGFLTHMVMGVALWMFPAPPGGGRAAVARSEPYGWASLAALASGLLLRAIMEIFGYRMDPPWLKTGLMVSAVLQVGAAVTFVVAMWDRTRPRTFVRQTTAAPPQTRAVAEGLELDLRQHADAVWLSAVLQAWNGVKPGQALVLVAARDPRGVVQMLHREQPDHPPFTYLERGPVWRVRVDRPRVDRPS